ncbi:type IV pilus twitching motility protein PilT [Flexilinea flocculi]|jgi:twitching motility protein PilT|uniref:Pilus retraction protein PilT n=1 Tax=Flexilinea flocculi TaxID=1678840 RepID=A0A0S7BV40_9CHLR|nr:PilT/PilU family type 4a pilus ATPase [Flexilinea flocculi]GAP40223.1 pilus retraction protein PilT [Flexilinea flocculi]
MNDLFSLLKSAVEKNASDIFIVTGFPISFKISGLIKTQEEERMNPEATDSMIREIYSIANRDITILFQNGDDDFSLSVQGLCRFRVSTYKQRGSLSAVIRMVSFGIPDYRKLGIPEYVMEISNISKGLVLFTGPAGSGKSTTLACLIDRINNTREGHIITLEEPIEYLHRDKKSIISQREIGQDSESFITALRASLRQAPNVILVGEMRDHITIQTAMTAAETGHLIISTLHTVGAANTIDRIIDVFPPNQQQQIRNQLSMILQKVVSQQLIPTVDGSLIPAFEVLTVNNAVRTMIRESKSHQIDSFINSSGSEGMVSMDSSIMNLFHRKIISRETALKFALNTELMSRKFEIQADE